MANPLFYDLSVIQGGYIPIPENHQEEAIINLSKAKNVFSAMDGLGGHDHHDQHGNFIDQHNKTMKGPTDHHLSKNQNQQQQPESKWNYSIFEDLDMSFLFPPTQPMEEISTISSTSTNVNSSTTHDIVEAVNKQMPSPTPFSSLELLSNPRYVFNKLNVEKIVTKPQTSHAYTRRQKLSTEEIVRIAGARFIQFSDQGNHDYLTPLHNALSGLPESETRDVELVHSLLAAAEKVGYQQFVGASRLLQNCEAIASSKSNPVERVVSIFAKALRERIEKENGSVFNGINRPKRVVSVDREKLVENDQITQGLSTNLATLNYHQQVPFLQVMQFPAVQAIVETFEPATKLHLIDLEIRSGIQWTGLMQALAGREERPIELLKITAIGVRGKENIEETRKRMVSLAESLNLPFLFKAVIVSDMEDIKEELFEIDLGETIAVHSSLFLRTMIWRRDCLEKLMRVIRNIRPSMMVVVEVEADHNSPSFARRFIEALFFFAAFFDCFNTCIDVDDFRTTMEGIVGVGIRNMVATEGSERTNRSVRIGVWRAFFARFRMAEMKLSDSSYYQASLVAKMFRCGSSCTLDRNGKCLIVGWKGTPIHSLSAWKFL